MKKTGFRTILSNTVKTLLLPVVVYLIFVLLTNGKFGTAASMSAMLRNACQSIILAWGVMLITGAGMWDFSAGAQLYLSALIVMQILIKYELGLIPMLLLLLVVNMALRALVAAIYSLVHVKSMVVTLALAMIFESAAKFFFGAGLTLKTKECLAIANSPWCFLILGLCLLLTIYIWQYTKFSFHVRALGSGENVARNIGLSPAKIRFKVFLVEGLFLTVTTALMIGTQANIRPPMNLSSNTLVFKALMATFIGLALDRYSNLIIGTAIGTIVMTMLNSGLLAMGVNSAWQVAITGIFMAVFIGFSTNQARLYRYFDDRKRAQEAELHYRQMQAQR